MRGVRNPRRQSLRANMGCRQYKVSWSPRRFLCPSSTQDLPVLSLRRAGDGGRGGGRRSVNGLLHSSLFGGFACQPALKRGWGGGGGMVGGEGWRSSQFSPQPGSPSLTAPLCRAPPVFYSAVLICKDNKSKEGTRCPIMRL